MAYIGLLIVLWRHFRLDPANILLLHLDPLQTLEACLQYIRCLPSYLAVVPSLVPVKLAATYKVSKRGETNLKGTYCTLEVQRLGKCPFVRFSG